MLYLIPISIVETIHGNLLNHSLLCTPYNTIFNIFIGFYGMNNYRLTLLMIIIIIAKNVITHYSLVLIFTTQTMYYVLYILLIIFFIGFLW